MLQIRREVFETNSSSTHSITMCSESEFRRWQRGEVYFNNSYLSSLEDAGMWLTKDEAIKAVMNYKYYDGELDGLDGNEIGECLADEFQIYSYLNYGSYLEYYEEHYTSAHGDNIVAFGEYGMDG